MNSPEQIVPGFCEWPDAWRGIEKDIPYGEGLIEGMRPFIVDLINQGLKRSTIRNHMDNLWLLGGEIIRSVSTHNDYKTSPKESLRRSVDQDGGLYCRHLTTESDVRSYDATCKKLYKFLEARE
jgi:hypothetical protein